MAYVTRGKAGSWEIRESVSTERGPRSRTLATFSELDDATLARAAERAAKHFEAEEVRRAALRKGAPVAEPPIVSAARTILGERARGATLPPALADLLAADLGRRSQASAAALAAAGWLDADPKQRAEALEDLLLLADHIPQRSRGKESAFPRLHSRPS